MECHLKSFVVEILSFRVELKPYYSRCVKAKSNLVWFNASIHIVKLNKQIGTSRAYYKCMLVKDKIVGQVVI